MLLEHYSSLQYVYRKLKKQHVNTLTKLTISPSFLETLIFTQISSVGARDMPFYYETICTSQYQTVNKGLERDAVVFNWLMCFW